MLGIYSLLFPQQVFALVATRHFLKLLGRDVLRNMISLLKEDLDEVYMASTRVYADIFARRRMGLKSEISNGLHN